MAVKTRLLCVGLALLCTGLLTTACQNDDPDPIPSAVLPTPAPPSPTPQETTSPDPDPTQSAIDEAVAAYSDGRKVAESMLVEQSDEDVTEALGPYFSGDYLNYWEAEFAEFREKDYSTDGTVRLTIMSASDYVARPESMQLSLFLCSDFSDVTTQDGEGSPVRRGFDVSYDEVGMLWQADAGWRADTIDSEVLSSLDGSPCEDVS